jgi:hypothetical protein
MPFLFFHVFNTDKCTLSHFYLYFYIFFKKVNMFTIFFKLLKYVADLGNVEYACIVLGPTE